MSAERYLNKYRIASARYVNHDYNGGVYFITVSTAQHEHYFGEIRNAEMILNVLGEFLQQNLQNVQTHYPYAEIPLFVVMPNHFHAIVIINDIDRRDGACPVSNENNDGFDAACPVSNENNDGFDAACHVSTDNAKMKFIATQRGLLSVTIGGIKSAITKYANTNKIPFAWQTRFYDRIIRDQDECNQIAIYIENNPAKWEIDKYRI